MCGIIGYVGPRASEAAPVQGLERLEYRGYDSAGLAMLEDEGLDYMRAVGNLQNLKQAAKRQRLPVDDRARPHPLGHARRVSEQNAHPLTGCDERKVAVVLNGIVENFRELKAVARETGHGFTIGDGRRGRRPPDREPLRRQPRRGRQATYSELEGHFAFVVIHHDHPKQLVGARAPVPALVGVGEGEMFLASVGRGVPPRDEQVQLIEDGEVVAITPEGATFTSVENGSVERDVIEVDWDNEAAEKAGYETFMLKEIYEQPEAVRETIGDRVRHGELVLEGIGLDRQGDPQPAADRDPRLRHLVPRRRRRPLHDRGVGADPRRARHRERVALPQPGPLQGHARDRDLAVGRDRATRSRRCSSRARRAPGRVAITNMMGSQMTREVDSVLYTRIGLEVGVAASKTFTAQVALI